VSLDVKNLRLAAEWGRVFEADALESRADTLRISPSRRARREVGTLVLDEFSADILYLYLLARVRLPRDIEIRGSHASLGLFPGQDAAVLVLYRVLELIEDYGGLSH
jgi:hypothetical protein